MCKYSNHFHGFIEILLGICGIVARIRYNSNRIFIVMSYLRLIHDTMVSYYSICTSFSPSGADIFTLKHPSGVRKQWRSVNGWYVSKFWRKILEMAQNGSKRTKNGSVENWRIRLSPALLSACFMAKTEINPRLIKYYVIISAIKVL